MFEGICNATIVAEKDTLRSKVFINCLRDEAETMGDSQLEGFKELEIELSSLTTAQLGDIKGIYKQWGYPLCEGFKGAEKQIEKMHLPYERDVIWENMFTEFCKKQFCKDYYAAKGRWPAVKCSESCHEGLRRALTEGKSLKNPSITAKGKIELWHWTAVEILPDNSMKFVIPSSYTTLLKDKAIAVTQDRAARHYLQNASIPMTKRRLLAKYLLEDGADERIHDEVTGIMGERWKEYMYLFVIKATVKEKELKRYGRWFASCTDSERMHKVVLEKNTKKIKKAFSRASTMTMTELEIRKKCYSMETLQYLQNQYNIGYLVVDTSSWNLHFNQWNAQSPVAETLGKFLGTNAYDHYMEIFGFTEFYFPVEGEKTKTVLPNNSMELKRHCDDNPVDFIYQHTDIVNFGKDQDEDERLIMIILQ